MQWLQPGLHLLFHAMPEMPPDPERKGPPLPLTAPAAGEIQRRAPKAQALMAPEQAPVLAQLASMLPALRLLVGLLIAALVIGALYFGRELLVPLALALLLGFLLDPAVSRLKRWGLPRLAATLVVVAITLCALGGMGAYLGNQVSQLSADLPTYQSTIRSKLRDLRQFFSGPSVWDGARKTYDTVEKEIASPVARQVDPRVQKVEVQPAQLKPLAQFTAWLERVSGPVLMAGIVLLFVILILLDRDDLRDRLLRLLGGNLHVATDALDEASARIGRYLRMQFIVNVSYGVPMAAGLWFIGVPGAILWGVVAAIMRFVPYVGPLVSAVFPLALAFAVDPGWNMLLWTLAWIFLLELISNNVVEPWLYGASTGLSTLSIILAATFWTALWGPVGLILSTPLTVCLLVLGRYLPALQFMEVLLGSAPVLGAPQRLYQRLLAGDVEEAIDLCTGAVDAMQPAKATPGQVGDSIIRLYDEVVMPALRMASSQHSAVTAGHRLRLAQGMDELLGELAEQYPRPVQPRASAQHPRVHCVGARWEMDALAAAAMAHALALGGQRATHSSHALAGRVEVLEAWEGGDWTGEELLCLSIFTPQPQAQARQICRRLRRRWPGLRIVLVLWNAPSALLTQSEAEQWGVQAVVTSMRELLLRTDALLAPPVAGGPRPAPVGETDAQRVVALHASGWLEDNRTGAMQDVVAQAANAFHVPFAQVSLVDADWVHTPGSLLVPANSRAHRPGLERAVSICAYVVYEGADLLVEDIARDPRFADNPVLQAAGVRFYAGVPLRDGQGQVLGSFCIMDTVPRTLASEELELLHDMARHLQRSLSRGNEVWPPPDAGPDAGPERVGDPLAPPSPGQGPGPQPGAPAAGPSAAGPALA